MERENSQEGRDSNYESTVSEAEAVGQRLVSLEEALAVQTATLERLVRMMGHANVGDSARDDGQSAPDEHATQLQASEKGGEAGGALGKPPPQGPAGSGGPAEGVGGGSSTSTSSRGAVRVLCENCDRPFPLEAAEDGYFVLCQRCRGSEPDWRGMGFQSVVREKEEMLVPTAELMEARKVGAPAVPTDDGEVGALALHAAVMQIGRAIRDVELVG